MGEETYDQDVDHEAVEPMGQPQQVAETVEEGEDNGSASVKAPEFVQDAEGKTNQPEAPSVPSDEDATPVPDPALEE